jgi:orotate phosphoribosyltransferase
MRTSTVHRTDRKDELRQQALKKLQEFEVLMRKGHFDYGNDYHGRVYLNPHQLFKHPSTIWRFAQDLLDVVPASILDAVQVVAGPVTGGALLAHTVAGLLDSRRELARERTLFAPFTLDAACSHNLSRFYQQQVSGRAVLLVDDVRNTGQTLLRCAVQVKQAGGTVLATAQIYDRLESVVDPGVPNIALAEYKATENFPAGECPMCKAGQPITSF